MLLAQSLILLLSLTSASARRTHKRLIVHVPFRIKTHHHTHTVYSHIRSASSDTSTGKGSFSGSGSGSSGSSGGTKQTIYKIISFAMQGKGYGGHTGHGGGGHIAHKSRHGGVGVGVYEHELVGGHGGAHDHSSGDIMYDDYHGGGDGGGGDGAGRCTDGPHGYGDMVFNHFSRSSDEYPEVEEYVAEDEQGFVWE